MRATTGTVELVPGISDSPLALSVTRIEPARSTSVDHGDADALLYVVAGDGALVLGADGEQLRPGGAGLVVAGETAVLEAGEAGLEVLVATVGPDADRHAPLGRRVLSVPAESSTEAASGSRSFRVLLGPHTGSTRATLFEGFVPPGRAPWHFHLYDEIVWIPEGPGRLHVGDAVEELGPGSAFRLRPRQVHIVENAKSEGDMTLVGVFTPAGSPSAAYLTPDVAAEYRFTGR